MYFLLKARATLANAISLELNLNPTLRRNKKTRFIEPPITREYPNIDIDSPLTIYNDNNKVIIIEDVYTVNLTSKFDSSDIKIFSLLPPRKSKKYL